MTFTLLGDYRIATERLQHYGPMAVPDQSPGPTVISANCPFWHQHQRFPSMAARREYRTTAHTVAFLAQPIPDDQCMWGLAMPVY